MKIKYLRTKLLSIGLATAATPLVWAAIAAPEWSAAGDIAPLTPEAILESPVDEMVPAEPVVLHEVVVIPRYVYTTEYVYVPAGTAGAIAAMPASAGNAAGPVSQGSVPKLGGQQSQASAPASTGGGTTPKAPVAAAPVAPAAPAAPAPAAPVPTSPPAPAPTAAPAPKATATPKPAATTKAS